MGHDPARTFTTRPVVSNARLEATDLTRVHRIPATTAARAILECAAILPADEDDRLERMYAEAHALNLGAPTYAPSRPSLESIADETRARAAALEAARQSDLPQAETNGFLYGRERDMVWRDKKIVVEADSYAFHSHSRPWARDIGETNELQLQGYLVLRFTWFDVTERPHFVIAKIRRRPQ